MFSGSFRVVESTRRLRSSSSLGSFAAVAVWPPPCRRIRPFGKADSPGRSLRCRSIGLRATPVANETAVTPPQPAACASAAATRRRTRSSRNGETASKRCFIAVVSIMTTRHGTRTPNGNPINPIRNIRFDCSKTDPKRPADGGATARTARLALADTAGPPEKPSGGIVKPFVAGPVVLRATASCCRARNCSASSK